MKILKIIAAVFVLLVACVAVNRTRYSEAHVTGILYQMTPLGTSYDEVLRRVDDNYKFVHPNERTGFLRVDPAGSQVVGVRSLEAHIVDYWHFPIGTTTVDAFWGFDRNNKLIEIWVWKTTDSL